MTQADRYHALGDALRAVDAEKTAAEAHGMLCGMLSMPGETEQARWIAEVLTNTQPKGELARQCLVALTELFDETREAVADADMGFSPLLPGDDDALSERALALADWCDGYLFGLGLGGLTSRAKLSAEAGEVVNDFAEIGRVDADADLGEQGEAAYAELLEYVRVGALLVMESMTPSTPKRVESQQPGSNKRRLH